MVLQILERRDARRVVELRVQHEPVPAADPLVPVRSELRPGAEEREVDVEEDGLEHQPRIRGALVGPVQRAA